jgi:hypothetical protein
MNHEIIETAMQEIMKEQKENRRLTERLTAKMDYLSAFVQSLKEQQNNRQTNVATQEVQTELAELKQLMRSQPKNVINEKRFLFFPEHNAREYYSVILRWILYIIIVSYSYSILKHIIDHWSK